MLIYSGEFVLTYMDEFIDNLLTEERVCDTILPRLTQRFVLEELGELEPRISPLQEEIDAVESEDEDDEQEEKTKKKKKSLFKEIKKRPEEMTEAAGDDLSIEETNRVRASLGLKPLKM